MRIEPKFIFLKRKKILELIETPDSRTMNWKKNLSLKTFENTYYQEIPFPRRNFFGVLMLNSLILRSAA